MIDIATATNQELVDRVLLIIESMTMQAEEAVRCCIRLYDHRAWNELGAASWEAMLASTGIIRLSERLTREEKRRAHLLMAEANMTTRAASAVTGMNNATVQRDTASAPTVANATVGLDGRVRRRPQRATPNFEANVSPTPKRRRRKPGEPKPPKISAMSHRKMTEALLGFVRGARMITLLNQDTLRYPTDELRSTSRGIGRTCINR